MIDFPKPKKVIADINAASIDELIAAYRDSIDLLRKECSKEIAAHKTVELADPNFGDDIYLLRYVLSHHKKGLEKAKNALLETIAWRAKDPQLLYRVRVEGQAPPKDVEIRRCSPASPHYRTKEDHLVYMLRNGCTNSHEAMEHVTLNELVAWMTLTKEWLAGKCDAETRAKGRLIKAIVIMDFKYGTLIGFNGEFKSATSIASKESELYYPQFLYHTCMINMPSVISSVLSFLMQFFPKSLREKILVCDETRPEEVCQWLRNKLHISARDIPTFLGGKCLCPGGCVKGIPNDQKNQLTVEEIKERAAALGSYSTFKAKADGRVAVEKVMRAEGK